MKIINTVIFAGLTSCSMMATASSSNDYLYMKLYRLAEKIYYIETSLGEEQHRIVDELSNQIDMIISIPNDLSCGSKSEVFQDAYKWSYSPDGLNYTSSEAEKFALQISNEFCPAAYLKIFKPAYKFAYSPNGMNKFKAEAKNKAVKISDYESSKFYVKNALQCYIDNYTYAYSSSGMNKSRSEAEQFADKQCLE